MLHTKRYLPGARSMLRVCEPAGSMLSPSLTRMTPAPFSLMSPAASVGKADGSRSLLNTRSSCGATPAFVIARSVLPDSIVPSTVTFHSVRPTVAPLAGEGESAAAGALGEAVGAEVGCPVGDDAAGGANVKLGTLPAVEHPAQSRASPGMTMKTAAW